MKRVRVLTLVGMALGLGLALGLAACSEDEGTKPEQEGDPYKPLTTIPNVIWNLKTAYVEKDFDEYVKLFHPDYRFFVDSEDVGELPLSWSRGRELAIAGSMLSGSSNVDGNQVREVRLSFGEGAPEPDSARAGWQRVALSAIELQVDTVHEDSGDPTLYITPAGALAEVYFVQTDEEDPDSHEKLWKIIEWRDRSSGPAKTLENTWSEIKALWTADPMPPYLPLTTIANVIHNLKLSYEEREYLEYRRLFHPDFTLSGTGSNGSPLTWGRLEELTSARRMLGGESNLDGNFATEIRVSFVEGPPETDPAFPDAQRVILSAVDLQVKTRNEVTGDPLLYITPAGTQEYLYLVQTTETDPGSGSPLWKIIRWEEPPPGGLSPATEPTSWAAIKTLFL